MEFNRPSFMDSSAAWPRATLLALAALALCACDRSMGAPDSPSASDGRAPAQQAANAAPAASRSAPPDATPRRAIPDRPPSDSEITAKAAKAMRADPALAGADLSVTTNHGVVSLTGTVRSPEQVALAESRAQSPSGVMRVDTHLSVDPER